MISLKLKNAYNKIPRTNKEKIKIRNKLVTKCGISTSIFYNWLRGATEIPELAKPVISEVMKIPMSELFPE